MHYSLLYAQNVFTHCISSSIIGNLQCFRKMLFEIKILEIFLMFLYMRSFTYIYWLLGMLKDSWRWHTCSVVVAADHFLARKKTFFEHLTESCTVAMPSIADYLRAILPGFAPSKSDMWDMPIEIMQIKVYSQSWL